MSKAVLISIRSGGCQKIMEGRKTIEVRKTRPKMDTPFKCYIYRSVLGGVVGEFICDRVTDLFENSRFWLNEDDILRTCLTADEIRAYANGANELYGWHISNLKIYDTPRELREFYAVPNEVEVALKAKPKPITRPPQSWRYVEEELWND